MDSGSVDAVAASMISSETYALPKSLLAATQRPRALQYLTRGLTSHIYTFDLDEWQRSSERQRQALEHHLHRSGASNCSRSLLIKCVDLDEQPRPHDVLREVEILKRIQTTSDERRRFVLPLLHYEEEVIDDFTTVQRLYLPRYPTTLAAFLEEDSASLAIGRRSISQRQNILFSHTLARQLFSALDFLHILKIFHRDVKPSNILLTCTPHEQAPTSFTIKLCDFGTAFAPGDKSSRPSTSSTSTHPYTPPELLFSPTNGYDGGAVDVWEAACVISEVLGDIQMEQDDDEPEAQGSGDSSNVFALGEDEADLADEEMEQYLGQHCLWPSSGPPQSCEGAYSNGVSRQVQSSKRPSWKSDRRYRRQPLFKGNQGDIGLAADIFTFLGLPEGDRVDLWPEAVHFHPPLSRLPFPRAVPSAMPETLQNRLPILVRALESPSTEENPEDHGDLKDETMGEMATRSVCGHAQAVQDVLVGSLRLSAQQRWTAGKIVHRLGQCNLIAD